MIIVFETLQYFLFIIAMKEPKKLIDIKPKSKLIPIYDKKYVGFEITEFKGGGKSYKLKYE